jgi:hypothetical protein
MSKTLLSILLSELKTIRIVCNNCKTIVEVPLEKMKNAGNVLCPGCPSTGKTVLSPASGSTVIALANAIIQAQVMTDVTLELSVPDESGG